MAKPEWGVKRACPNCSVRFYDLMKDPVVCPNCESVFPLETFTERRGSTITTREKPTPAKAPVEDAEVLIDDDDDDDDDEDVLLDDDDDDDSDDDISDIADVGDKEEET